MGRKFNLKKEISTALRKTRKNSFMTKKDRLSIMKLIVDDLMIATNYLPTCIADITAKNIADLVKYWQANKIDSRTIANRLSVLRAFNHIIENKLEVPNNKELGLVIKGVHRHRYCDIPEDILTKVFNPITRSIIEFQMKFGLTKLESMNINLSTSLQQDNLFIYRNIASNHKDRSIPILSHQQKQLIENRKMLTGNHQSILEAFEQKHIMNLYDAELACAHIDAKTPFRKAYINQRYIELLQPGQPCSSDLAMNTLLYETGMTTKYKLKEWLEWIAK